MEIDWKACGQRIRDARRKKGMTQERLAKAAAISANSIRRIEHGQPTRVSTLRIIARTLRVSMDYLLDGIETYMDAPEIAEALQFCNEINCQLANCTPSQLRYIAEVLLPVLLLRDEMERTDRWEVKHGIIQ